jgi:hypothetical protein
LGGKVLNLVQTVLSEWLDPAVSQDAENIFLEFGSYTAKGFAIAAFAGSRH